MEVRVDIETEHINHEKRALALTANFVMVALDDKGKPTSIPKLILLTEEEEKLFAKARERYKTRKMSDSDIDISPD